MADEEAEALRRREVAEASDAFGQAVAYYAGEDPALPEACEQLQFTRDQARDAEYRFLTA